MRIGVSLPQYGAMGAHVEVPYFARAAEEMSYDSLWVGDRLLTPTEPSDPYPAEPKPYPDEFTTAADPFVVWAAAAAVTSTVRIGASTLVPTWYSPVHLARALTSLDVLSGGRIDVGFGTSWMRDEYRASGSDWDTRGRRLNETLEVLKRWWSANPFEFHGEFVDVPESIVNLRPAQAGGPPVYLGGQSAAPMRRIGRLAAGWLTIDGAPAKLLADLWATALRSADAAGRDSTELRRIVRINSKPGDTVDSLAGRLGELAKDGNDEAFVDFTYIAGSAQHAVDLASGLASKLAR